MNKYLIFILFTLFCLNISAQWRKDDHRKIKENITTSINGDLLYENNEGLKAKLATNIFGDKTYEDNRNNKITYSKEVVSEAFPKIANNPQAILKRLARNLGHRENYKEVYKRNIHGTLLYERGDNFKASIEKNFFGEVIYKDSYNNQQKLSKEFWENLKRDFDNNEIEILFWMMDQDQASVGKKTELARDIHGRLNYEKDDFKATLQENIFNDGVYTDSNKNEVKFSKEFWSELLRDYDNSDTNIFFEIMDQCKDLKNYKEEYKIDIFGHRQYSNNQREKASLSTNIHDRKIYEDSKGNKIEYAPDVWKRLISRYKTENKIFLDLVRRHLFEKSRR
ncbi:MAG: hypothetical protein E6767_02115 [Dysgonomonas sp.]|nr:hypothetical protein [Dysgonomonas sp.]